MLIEMNLLPESYYKARRLKRLIVLIVLFVIVAASALTGLYVVMLAQILDVNNRIKDIEVKQSEFAQILNEMDNIKKTNASVTGYLSAINELKDKQVFWPIVLDNFNKTVPDNVWLNSFTNKTETGGGRIYTVTGIGLFKESVADFIANLNNPSSIFRNAFLINMSEAELGGRISYNFVLSFQTVEDSRIKPARQMNVSDVSKTGVYGNNYINKEYNCSIFIPDGWRISNMSLSGNVLVAMEKEKKEGVGKYTPLVTVSAQKLLKASITPKEFQEFYQKKFSVWQSYEKLGEKEFTIGGEKVYDLEYFWKVKAKQDNNKLVPLIQRQIFCVKGDTGFIITCSDSEDSYKSNKEEFSIIFNSLKLQ